MISSKGKIKQKVQNNKSLIESFLSLSLLNGLSSLIPLVVTPYILRVVGTSGYGIYSYIYVLIQYLLLFTNFGFNFSATQQIAQNRDNINFITRVYNTIIVCKLLLFTVGVFVFLLLSPFLLETPTMRWMFLYGIGIVIGEIFNPIWLFQGMEKMRYITIVNLLSKVIFTILIFMLIRTKDDYIYIILFNSISFMIGGIISTFVAFKQFRITLYKPIWKEITQQYKKGFALFSSTIGIELYRNANTFILKFFVDDTMLGIYAAAEKIVKSLQMLLSPVSQALFPHFGKKFNGQSVSESIYQLKKMAKIFSIFSSLLSLCTFVFAEPLVTLFAGSSFIDAVPIVRIMSAIILLGSTNGLIGIGGLVNLKQQTYFFLAVMISGIISVCFLLTTVSYWGIYAAAWSMLIAEVVVFIFCLVRLKKINKI